MEGSDWAAAGTAGAGLGQVMYAQYLKNRNKRPTYSIPDEIKQNLTQAQMEALEGLPEAQKQEFVKNIERTQASSLSQLGSRKAGLAGVANLNLQSQDAYEKMLAMDAQARRENLKALKVDRQVMADYKDQAFQLNKLNPYYEKVSESEALMGAGLQNISNAGTLYASGRNKSNETVSNGTVSNSTPTKTVDNKTPGWVKKRMGDISYDEIIDEWVNEQDALNVTAEDRQRLNPAVSRDEANSYKYPYGGKVGDDKDKKGKKKPQYELKREFKKIEPEYQLMQEFKEIEPEYQLMQDFREVDSSDSSKTSTKKYPYGGQVTGADNSSMYASEDATWNTVGQFGAVGKVIQGSANLGNAIGRPVRSKNEEIDPETGKLKNYKSHLTIGGGMLNPLTALQTRSKYKGGFGDIDGSGYKNYLEEQARPEVEAYQKEKAEAKKAETMANYITMMNNSQTQNQYPYGGKVGKKKIVEIEKQEVVKDTDGSIFVADAPSHNFGGQDVAVNDGAIILSDRLKVPGENITFAKKAKKKIDDLFKVQERYKLKK
jgi:hypothetical protein